MTGAGKGVMPGRAHPGPVLHDRRIGWRRAMRLRGIQRARTGGRGVGSPSVIVAAIDDSPTAVPVARWAGEVARAGGGEIVVFVAPPVLPEIHGLARTRWPAGSEAIRREAAATVGRVQPVLASMGAPFRVEAHPRPARRWAAGRARQAAKASLRAARDVGADLIVVGHRPSRRHRRSSVAAMVVRRARCDVLVVPFGIQAADVGQEQRADVGEGVAS